MENMASLYIFATAIVTLAGLFSFCQFQLRQQTKQVRYYMAVEQLIQGANPELPVYEGARIQQSETAIKVSWPDGFEVSCCVES
ncbi:hypothetical protein FC83_GL001271 [Agrilactobacillus composti DSM 18527 = JCM 14202]|uniref:Uncharacterized protein n=2 Tax=Agrilactobacillus TaxID=2767875 RepID=X0PSK8_9LACO|nr:hypothetical protein FC83_GL001271 [Agrilactobacillus composti DSM 18527 = JCM 14202]GAF40231.1 hypothetical protein JCM14202_2121 [Agrilactobacillus composti DSM 18527 = JCM 14202]